ncbi:EPT/RTPC-like protein [Stipitochalara longipes BDJ]|nr:EPT/RTPC-like protein [Stipitochalara longipes BDJ]
MSNSNTSAETDHGVAVVLAGNTLEGGGGLIRDALTYSTIFDKGVRIESIRADRPGPGGLRVEHTIAIDVMSSLCNAKVEGNAVESRTLTYLPYQASSSVQVSPKDRLELELEGSASISLVALFPYLLFSHLSPASDASHQISRHGINLKILGGTLCVKAPSIHYLIHVLIPTLNSIGFAGQLGLAPEYKQGWHTEHYKTRGMIQAWVKPLEKPVLAFQLLGRGRIVEITAIGTVKPSTSAMAAFERILRRELQSVFESSRGPHEPTPPTISIRIEPSNQPAEYHPTQYHLFLAARAEAPEAYLGYDQVYPQSDAGFPSIPEDNEELILTFLTRVCIRGLVEELQTGSSVDDHLMDILTPYQVLAVGRSTIALKSEEGSRQANGIFKLGEIDEQYRLNTSSLHKETAHWVAEQMTGAKFIENAWSESCDGIALGVDGPSFSEF